MLQIRRDADLAQEALDSQDGAELRTQDFERHSAIVTQIAREVDDCHSAGADLAVDGVAPGKCGPKLAGDVHAPNLLRAVDAVRACAIVACPTVVRWNRYCFFQISVCGPLAAFISLTTVRVLPSAESVAFDTPNGWPFIFKFVLV